MAADTWIDVSHYVASFTGEHVPCTCSQQYIIPPLTSECIGGSMWPRLEGGSMWPITKHWVYQFKQRLGWGSLEIIKSSLSLLLHLQFCNTHFPDIGVPGAGICRVQKAHVPKELIVPQQL